MLKNKLKIFPILFILLLFLSTISFSTDTNIVPISETGDNITSTLPGDNARTEQNETVGDVNNTNPQVDIRNNDLYIFNTNVVMDQLVDGNVYIVGNTVEISGKVNGNLIVLANKVKFLKGSYVVNSIYAFANEVEFSGNVNDFHAFADKVTMTYDGFAIRDLNVVSNNFDFNGGIGRNAFVASNNFNFTQNQDQPAVIYGNLNYFSNNELDLSNNFVQGDINYNKLNYYNNIFLRTNILQTVLSFFISLTCTFVIYLLIIWLAPKFNNNISKYISKKTLPVIGVGLSIWILLPIICTLFLISGVGTAIGISLLAIYFIIALTSFAFTNIAISNKIKEKYNLSKGYMTFLLLILSTLFTWGISRIPYIGFVLSILVYLFGTGCIFMYLFTKNKSVENNISEN
ncbi:MAG: hypothetical protein HFJ53_01320 [Clostridia bacterium]|jgi:hypothetical protein|nr:hypothetical protein [Clostridia bacterium]